MTEEAKEIVRAAKESLRAQGWVSGFEAAELRVRLRAAEQQLEVARKFAADFIHWVENDAPEEWDGGSLGYDMGGFFSMAQDVLAGVDKPA